MTYRFSEENPLLNTVEMLPLYCKHYEEMRARQRECGDEIPNFDPDLETYHRQWIAGIFKNYVARIAETNEPVGYANVYVLRSMHTKKIIAEEDTIYVLPEHRNGLGKKLLLYGLDKLHKQGVTKLYVRAMTDARVEKLWKRMGFKTVAACMVYDFAKHGEKQSVQANRS